MLIRAVYRGVNYHEPVTPGQATADVEVFEPTDKARRVQRHRPCDRLQPSASGLTVGEEYTITNKTQPPVAYYRADGSFVFSLPDGAQLDNVSAAGSAGMPVIQSTIDKGKNKSAIVFPFRPGDSEVRISYKLRIREIRRNSTLFRRMQWTVSRFSRRPRCKFQATVSPPPGKRRVLTFTCARTLRRILR